MKILANLFCKSLNHKSSFLLVCNLDRYEIDAYLPINTGQILSIPLVIAGIYLLWNGLRKKDAVLPE
jgi:prolipoprotein diacylglyceryltransferase